MQASIELVNEACVAIIDGDIDGSIKRLNAVMMRTDANLTFIPPSFTMSVISDNDTHVYDEGMSVYLTPMKMSMQSVYSDTSVKIVIQFNLGVCYALQGKDDDAFASFSRCLELRHAFSNLQNAALLCNMGSLLYRMKDYKKSEVFFIEALSMVQKIYGKYHKDVASILNSLGVVALCLGSSSCLEYLEEALQVHEHLGLDSLDDSNFATLHNNLGRAKFFQKEYFDAIFHFERAYEIRTILLDKCCPDVTVVEYNLGQANKMVGNTLTALHLFQRMLSNLRENDSNVSYAHMQIASIYSERKDFNTAIEHYSLALEHTKRFEGEISIRVSYILNQMGNLYCEIDDVTSALNIYLEGLRIEYNIVPFDPHKITRTSRNVANIYQIKGELSQALKYYMEALEVQTAKIDESDLSLAELMANIGHCHDHLGDHTTAIHYYEHALLVRRKILGGNDYVSSTILNAIGVIWYKQGVLGVALKTFQDSLTIRRTSHCQDSDLAIVLYNKACVELDMGNIQQALVNLIESLHNDLVHSSVDAKSVFSVLEMIGCIFKTRGDFDQALNYFIEGVSFGMNNSSVSFCEVTNLLNHIGNIYLQKGDNEHAIEMYTEISRLNCNNGLEESTRIRIFDFLDQYKPNLPCAPAA
jgi:tetratricopeptide (TPR) repeat protein